MPGTDICLKIGGWVRAEITDPTNGNLTGGNYTANAQQRQTNNLTDRARGYITADARNQTEYGTVRSYIAVGLSTTDFGNSPAPVATYSNRAFIQWAGITAGIAQSFYDFWSTAAIAYRAGELQASDTGDSGWWVWGYTAQLGNGFTATVSAEARRGNQIIEQGSTGALIGAGTIDAATTALNGYGGWQAPDIVGNLRVDQAWGSAQVMGAAHEVNPLYYGASTATIIPENGHPSDQWGFAVGAGLKINFPTIAQGDYFSSQVNYAHGASRYEWNGNNSTADIVNGNNQGYGVLSDCVFGGAVGTTATSCELTTAWSVGASYEHYWTPQWHESFYGSYLAVSYDTNANNMLCQLEGGGNGSGLHGGVGTNALATPGCNNNWSAWTVGSRLQWDVTKTLYLGVEALYSNLNTAQTWNGLLPSSLALSGTGLPTGTSAVSKPARLVLYRSYPSRLRALIAWIKV